MTIVMPPEYEQAIEQLLRITKNRQAAAVLLEAAGCGPEQVSYMASPFVVCQSPDMAEQFPLQLMEMVLLSRLETISAETKQGPGRRMDKLAPLAEVWGYLYPAAVMGSLPRPEWNRIWLWLAGQLSRCNYLPPEVFWGTFGTLVTAEPELSDHELMGYQHLAGCIRFWTTRRDRLVEKNPYSKLDSKFSLPHVVQSFSFEACFRKYHSMPGA